MARIVTGTLGACIALACASSAPPVAPAPVRPAPPAASAAKPAPVFPDFTFVVAADSHAVVKDGDHGVSLNSAFVQNIEFLKQIPGDFLVIAGDVTDGHAEPPVLEAMWRQFGDLERRLGRKLVLVPGNHDVYDESSERIWQQRNGPTYRSFDHEGSHFIVLNSEDQAAPQRIDGVQLVWLAGDLAHDTARHTFVFLHRPLWIESPDNWNSKVHPLLAQHHVDTVFAGHWHRYCLCPTRDGVRYVVASSIGKPNDEVGGFLSALPVTVTSGGSSYRVVQTDGTELPPTVVRRDWLEATQNSVTVQPVAPGTGRKDARIAIAVRNPLDVAITGTATLDVEGTEWKAAQAPIDAQPGRQTTVEIETVLGKKLTPLPRLTVELAAGETRLEKHALLPDVADLPRVKQRILDDFEDGNLLDAAKANGIAHAAGQWNLAMDTFGSTIPVFGVEKLKRDGGEGTALHLAGHHALSHDPNWCWAQIQDSIGKPEHGASLAPSIGISFSARADHPGTLWVVVEGTVKGVRVAGTGAGHYVELHPSSEWKTYTFYWQDFRQPSWACPGAQCANAPLTVDKVENIAWSFRDEDRDFDLWLDDVRLLYEQ